MQIHQLPAEEAIEVRARADEAPYAALPAIDRARLEAGLQRACHLAARAVAPALRPGVEELARAEVERTVAACLELGMAPGEAARTGLARLEGRGVEHRQQASLHTRLAQFADSGARDTLLAFVLMALPWLADNTKLAWRYWSAAFHLSASGGPVADAAFYRFELLAIPALCGLLIGFLARTSAPRAVFRGLMWLTIPALFVPGSLYVATLLAPGASLNSQPPAWLDHLQNLIPNPHPATFGAAYWAMIGCCAAWLGQRIRMGLIKTGGSSAGRAAQRGMRRES